ncbi:MAG: BlaI/MecI/CopY family transcriptional regulator [Planctomycetaceae bacterium]
MSRPKSKQPTPAELEILKVLWEREPATAREVLEVLNADGNRRAYTTIASLMNVMVEKRFLTREPEGGPIAMRLGCRKKTLTGILSDLVGRAFEDPRALSSHTCLMTRRSAIRNCTRFAGRSSGTNTNSDSVGCGRPGEMPPVHSECA